MKNRIIADGGSIQRIPNIPDDIKALYKTVWEISQRTVIQMAADRGAFIDQSQSLNIHMKEPSMGKITSMHFAGWKLGLKTGMYYLRTMAASAPIQFTVDQEQLKVADTNVARGGAYKKRTMINGGNTSNYSSPKPMYVQKQQAPVTPAPNGIPTPADTPPSAKEAKNVMAQIAATTQSTDVKPAVKDVHTAPPFKADIEEGNSPQLLSTDASGDITPSSEKGDQLDEADPVTPKQKQKGQVEDKENVSSEREGDIYAEAVLQCSIENKEACLMCSG